MPHHRAMFCRLSRRLYASMTHLLFQVGKVEYRFDGQPEVMGDLIGQGEAGGVAAHLDGRDGLPGGAHGLGQLLLGELAGFAQLGDLRLDGSRPPLLSLLCNFSIVYFAKNVK